jgi:hypothetical protein
MVQITTQDLSDYIRRPEDDHTAVSCVVCQDGTSLSVQAGKYIYSTPRENNEKYYYKVEVGYP